MNTITKQTTQQSLNKLTEFLKKSKLPKNRMLVQKLVALLEPHNLALKLEKCSTFIILAECKTPEEIKHRLYQANFCKNRLCPLCTVLKSRKRLRSLLLNEERIKGNYLFLTLTVPDIQVQQQRETVQRMAKSFNKLKQYPCWKSVIGYTRSLETTRGKTNDSKQSHPHLHALLEVKPSYFNGQNYIPHAEWLRSWRDAYQMQEITQVNIKRLRPNPNKRGFNIFTSFLEALKYELKPDNWQKLKPNETKADLRDWLITYAEQMNNVRSMSTGGTLKGILTNPKKLEDEDFKDEEILRFLAFSWIDRDKEYKFSKVLTKDQVDALRRIKNFKPRSRYFDGKKLIC